MSQVHYSKKSFVVFFLCTVSGWGTMLTIVLSSSLPSSFGRWSQQWFFPYQRQHHRLCSAYKPYRCIHGILHYYQTKSRTKTLSYTCVFIWLTSFSIQESITIIHGSSSTLGRKTFIPIILSLSFSVHQIPKHSPWIPPSFYYTSYYINTPTVWNAGARTYQRGIQLWSHLPGCFCAAGRHRPQLPAGGRTASPRQSLEQGASSQTRPLEVQH